jgi:alpha-beta hydrolase superfamily lysophospholipase
MKTRLISLLVTTGLIALCLCLCLASSDSPGRADFNVEQVKAELVPLSFESPSSYPAATRQYFDYYGLEIEGAEHFFGTFSSSNHVLAAHVFKPRKSKSTVIVLHGYYDHTGTLKHLIKNLVEQHYTVAIYDQPGHGLSSGARASIDDFSEYATVWKDFLAICRNNLDGPFHLVAHSMGCLIAADYLLTTGADGLDNIVFISPLIRSVAWKVSGFGLKVSRGTIDQVPRAKRQSSSNDAFNQFMKDDPLQADNVPMAWVTALRKWNEEAGEYETSDKPLTIIQGTRDTVVAWKYNIPFLQSKFTNADPVLIKKGRHHLLNESLPMRDTVLDLINKCLNDSGLDRTSRIGAKS